MSWGFLLSLSLAFVYLVWIWRDRKAYNRAGLIFCLIGSAGILITLSCDYIRTLPSHAPCTRSQDLSHIEAPSPLISLTAVIRTSS